LSDSSKYSKRFNPLNQKHERLTSQLQYLAIGNYIYTPDYQLHNMMLKFVARCLVYTNRM